MDDRPAEPVRSRRRLAIGAVAACVVIGAGGWALAQGSSSDGPDDAEVCDATEYEGCIARWDYLLEDD